MNLPDELVASWAAAPRCDTQALAREVQARRALDAIRRCDSCAHGFVNPRYPIAEVGVRCEWLKGAVHFKADHYCGKWVQREA